RELPRGAGERLAIHAGAGWGNKRWPPERWGEVARRLAEATGLPVHAVAGPGEEGLSAAVAAASAGAAVAVPAPDLPSLAGELLASRLLLAGDTGPLHLAHALGVPVLAVMGPTDPRRHGPYAALDRAVWQTLPCSFCYKRFAETKACLHAVGVERVVERALALLASDAASETYSGHLGPRA
ncbi:MAG TPA: glycosyltransferase family 9 protein, partial [Thermoanaerobaculia bacterium]|nr:glycosyltransferase family 9 protein [Thermoanaerobaculia bacterium]